MSFVTSLFLATQCKIITVPLIYLVVSNLRFPCLLKQYLFQPSSRLANTTANTYLHKKWHFHSCSSKDHRMCVLTVMNPEYEVCHYSGAAWWCIQKHLRVRHHRSHKLCCGHQVIFGNVKLDACKPTNKQKTGNGTRDNAIMSCH